MKPMLPESMRVGARLAADSRPDSRQELGLAAAAENYNSTAILSEQRSSETRVVNEADRARRASIAEERQEFAAAYDLAQRALRAKAPLVDRNSVPYAIGQDVRSIMELWCSSPNRAVAGPFRMLAGTRGVITKVNERIVAVMFEGRTEVYSLRADQAKTAIEVVK